MKIEDDGIAMKLISMILYKYEISISFLRTLVIHSKDFLRYKKNSSFKNCMYVGYFEGPTDFSGHDLVIPKVGGFYAIL